MDFKKELADIGDFIVENNPKLLKAVAKHNRAKDKNATDNEIHMFHEKMTIKKKSYRSVMIGWRKIVHEDRDDDDSDDDNSVDI